MQRLHQEQQQLRLGPQHAARMPDQMQASAGLGRPNMQGPVQNNSQPEDRLHRSDSQHNGNSPASSTVGASALNQVTQSTPAFYRNPACVLNESAVGASSQNWVAHDEDQNVLSVPGRLPAEQTCFAARLVCLCLTDALNKMEAAYMQPC